MAFGKDISDFQEELAREEFQKQSFEDQAKARREFADKRLIPTLLNSSDEIFLRGRETGEISARKKQTTVESENVARSLNLVNQIQPIPPEQLTPEQVVEREQADLARQEIKDRVRNNAILRSVTSVPDFLLRSAGQEEIKPQIEEALKGSVTENVFPLGATPEEIKLHEDEDLKGSVLGTVGSSILLAPVGGGLAATTKAGLESLKLIKGGDIARRVLLPITEALNVNALAATKTGQAGQGALLGISDATARIKEQEKDRPLSNVEKVSSSILGAVLGVAPPFAIKEFQRYLKGLKGNIPQEEIDAAVRQVGKNYKDAVDDIMVDQFIHVKDKNSTFLDDIFDDESILAGVPNTSELTPNKASTVKDLFLPGQPRPSSLPVEEVKRLKTEGTGFVEQVKKNKELRKAKEFLTQSVKNLDTKLKRSIKSNVDIGDANPETAKSFRDLANLSLNYNKISDAALQDLQKLTGQVTETVKKLKVPGSTEVKGATISTPLGFETVKGFKGFLKEEIAKGNKFVQDIFAALTDNDVQAGFARTQTNIPKIIAQTQLRVSHYIATNRNTTYQHLQDLKFRPSEYKQTAFDLANKTIDQIKNLSNSSAYNQKLKTIVKFIEDSSNKLGIKSDELSSIPEHLQALARMDEDFAIKLNNSGLVALVNPLKAKAINFRDILDDYSQSVVRMMYGSTKNKVDEAIEVAEKEGDGFLVRALQDIKKNFDLVTYTGEKSSIDKLLSFIRINEVQNRLAFNFKPSLLNGTQPILTGTRELGIKSIPNAITLLQQSPKARELLRSLGISEQLLSRMEIGTEVSKGNKLFGFISQKLDKANFGVRKDIGPFAITEEANQVYAVVNGFIQEAGGVGNWLQMEKNGLITKDFAQRALLRGQELNKRYNFVPNVLGRSSLKNEPIGKFLATYLNHPLGEAALVSDWIQSGDIDAVLSYTFMKGLLGGKDGARVFILDSTYDMFKEQNPELARDLDDSFEVVERLNVPKKFLNVSLGHRLGVFNQFDVLANSIGQSIPILSTLQQGVTKSAQTLLKSKRAEASGFAPDTPLTAREKLQEKSGRAKINEKQLSTDQIGALFNTLSLFPTSLHIPIPFTGGKLKATVGQQAIKNALVAKSNIERGGERFFGEGLDVKNATIKEKTQSFVQQNIGDSPERADLIASKTFLKGEAQKFLDKGVFPPKEVFRRSNKTEFEILDNGRKEVESKIIKQIAVGLQLMPDGSIVPRQGASEEDVKMSITNSQRLLTWLGKEDIVKLLARNQGIDMEDTGFFLPDNQAYDRRKTERFKKTLK